VDFGIGRDQGGALTLQRLIPTSFRSFDHFSPLTKPRAMSGV
jgi:hypothetical protein